MVNSQTLLQMQKDYDAVKDKIASTVVEINCLDADKKSAYLIKTIVYQKLHELDSALTATKNYRQADQKYKELIRVFNDDPETIVIRSNYKDFKEAEALRLELLKNNNITLTEFESWKKKILDKYKSMGGANFQGRTGAYNSMSDLILNN
jgi:hypothetical protein